MKIFFCIILSYNYLYMYWHCGTCSIFLDFTICPILSSNLFFNENWNMHACIPVYVPAKDENPDGCLLSSFLLNSENFAGVTSSPALAGENSSIPAPLSRISSSEESSKDIDTVGPSSASLSRRRRRARDGWKLNSWGCSSRPKLTNWQFLSWINSYSHWLHIHCTYIRMNWDRRFQSELENCWSRIRWFLNK